MAANQKASGEAGGVSITALSLPQLADVKKQLEEELSHLTTSFGSLKAAQTKFKNCLLNLSSMVPENDGKSILVPLTNSLYVPGKLIASEDVIVDIGTGYYVTKSTSDAGKFYQSKIDFVTTQLASLQTVIERKQENLQMVVGLIQQKMAAGERMPAA